MTRFIHISLLLIATLLLSGCGGEIMENEEEITATIKTNQGDIVLALYGDEVPVTVQNFVDLANEGFYDNTIFHRVIDGFMIQGGDPTGTGRGGPGYTIEDEFHPELRHDSEGVLSMANAGPDTGGSQFFITLDATPHLDDKHSVFGEVVEGMDVVRLIGRVRTGAGDRPVDEVRIESIEINN